MRACKAFQGDAAHGAQACGSASQLRTRSAPAGSMRPATSASRTTSSNVVSTESRTAADRKASMASSNP